MTDIGTRRIFSEDHDILRASVRRFFQDEVAPYHREWEKAGLCPRWIWEKAGETGLLGVNIPEECGGHGGDFLSAMVVMEEQCYANVSGPGFPMHSDIVMHYLFNYGTPEQLERLVPDMMLGKKIGALAMTEPGAGSDVQGIRSMARKDGDDYILNGSKVFITNGYLADVFIVVAITDTEAKNRAHGLSLFIVEEGMEGFKKGKKLDKIGMHAQDAAELFFDDVRLPSSALLGKPNGGFYALMKELPRERLMIGAQGLANCEMMFEITRDYVKERKAFGKTLSKLQTIQHNLAEMKSKIVCTRAFVDQSMELQTLRKLDSSTASMVKYLCTDLQNEVATKCLQLHGGWGYMADYGIARAFVDARVTPIYGGSNEIMKELIAREIVAN